MAATGTDKAGAAPAYAPGTRVRIRADAHPGHHRTPLYIKGRRGVVVQYVETARNPETLAYGKDGTPRVPVYQVRFAQAELWPGYHGPRTDTLLMDILEHWLERAE
ncbi:MAG TPA: SH3-like domain-containing protein [bacterium]|nr:SH3-like domain-containing protein [bacterium]